MRNESVISKIKTIMKKIFAGFLTVLTLFLGGLLFVQANPLQISPLTSTAAATTTVSYMTPGTGTTTLQYDSYGTGQPRATDRAALLVQFTASTSASILGISLEYSQDAVDWYFDNKIPQATTTQAISLQTPTSYSWIFASSTPGGLPGATFANRVGKVINVDIPTRYVRAVFTNTGAAAGVYASFVPQKQISE